MSRIVAVMAGTPVDTRMGVEMLGRQGGFSPLAYPTASSPREQHAFQLGPVEERRALVKERLRRAKGEGAQALLVYCNSLAGSLDFEAICREEGLPLVTPLMVHGHLAARSSRLGLIAANNQSLHGIERAMFARNPRCDVLGASLMPVVVAIEEGMHPDEIVGAFGLDKLLDYFAQNQVEQVALGCTHFGYIRAALEKRTSLPIFDPDEAMTRLLREAIPL
ncbi:MAG TPA: aspartate/glutamate racemase family protein [Firmicutes bacterium]|nr:aspartate/glutamate racemase family protein [Bacillota bacterium]